VSIAYGHHHDHPLLDGPVKLLKSLSAALDKVMTGNDPDERERDEEVLCFCFPCVSFGSSNAGRAAVRTCFVFLFPLLLLGMFLVNDVGRVVIRSMKLRTEIHDVGSHVKAPNLVNKVSLRRKMVHKFPGYKREVLFIPLDQTIRNAEPVKCPRGILFLFHGCSRYAASFFYSPQGRRIVAAAHKNGLSIVAVTKDKEKGCWNFGSDGATVLNVGKKFVSSRMAGACGTDENGDVIAPPIYAFGASSGGAIIAKLASKMEEEPEKYRPFIFSAINVQIYAPSEQWDWNTPTIFTVMQGDDLTKNRVKDRVKAKFQGGPFRVIETSGQKAITPFHFRELYFDDLHMTDEISREIYEELITMGIIDAATGMLKADPRTMENAVTSVWQKFDKLNAPLLSPPEGLDSSEGTINELPFGLTPEVMRPLRVEEIYDANSIWLIEELNVAFDSHEITSEGFETDVLPFFLDHAPPKILNVK